MKRSQSNFPAHFYKNLLKLFIGLILLGGCKDNEPREEKIIISEEKTAMDSSEAGIINVVTEAMDFQMVKSVPSGWTTITYRNQSADTHFLALEKYPEGKNMENAKKEIIPIFQKAMDSIAAGKNEAGMAQFGNLPEWFQKVEFFGGTGLIASGKIAQSTVNLEPGTYIVECYVKMNNGMFHSTLGMINELKVTDEKNGKEPPTPTSEINISKANGMVLNKNPQAGRNIFKVNFEDQNLYENYLQHDVHLVKIADGADIKTLEKWMNWMDPKGFISPIPKGFEFLGGMQEMPAGNSGYFTADLNEGNYAFISEIPDASKHKMLKEFKINRKDVALK